MLRVESNRTTNKTGQDMIQSARVDAARSEPTLLIQFILWCLFAVVKTWVGNHDKSSPIRSAANSIAENGVRRVKESTSSLLGQSGLSEKWWREAMECFCHLPTKQDKDLAFQLTVQFFHLQMKYF